MWIVPPRVGQRNLPAHRRRRLFAAPVVGPQRAVHVVEPHQAGIQAIILRKVQAELLGVELLPAVARLRVRWVSVFLAQGIDCRIHLFRLRVNASRGRKKKSLYILKPAGFEHVHIDQRIVAGDVCMIGRNKPDAAHVRRQVVNLIDASTRSDQAIVELAEIQKLELVRLGGFVFRLFDVHASHPVTVRIQAVDQVMSNKPPRTRN